MYDRPYPDAARAARVELRRFLARPEPITGFGALGVTRSRWLVRMVVEGEAWRDAWVHTAHVWADSSTDAVGRARDEFYGTWATLADRQRLPLRVLEVCQVGT